MRRIWLALVILAALFAAALWHSRYLDTFVQELTDQLEQADAHAAAGDWEKAEALTERVCARWQNSAFYLHITLRHGDTDEVSTGLREVLEYAARRDPGQYFAANARVIARLELIAEAERSTLENIL